MPAIVDFEHEDLNFELASGTELGMPGLSVRYGNDGRVSFAVTEELSGTSVDIKRVDANSVMFESIHMDLWKQAGGLSATAVAKDRYGHVTEYEEIQKSSSSGSSFAETILKYPSGQLKEAIALTSSFAGHSSRRARDPNGRVLRSSELNVTEIGGSVITSGINRDAYGRTLNTKELIQTQLQTGNIVGDFSHKDALGRNERTIHFTNTSFYGGVARTDAVVRDGVGKLTEKIIVDNNSAGSGVTQSRVVVQDALGRTKETLDVDVRIGAVGARAQFVRKSALGQVLEKMEVQVR
ncbi:MAG: hypothetical protein K2X77_25985 [Candidatus Obscuribacterales bacterium]|jgi:hypothetical protein|nr:hypothetical protein [Candidatus Obscuribacterales bacterium]